MADLITLQKWDDDSQSASGQYFVLKDEDFDIPSNIKKVYRVTITYKASAAVNMNVLLTYAVDGSTSFGNTYVPATSVPIAAGWNIASIQLSTPVSIQSIMLKFSPATGTFNVNDISVEKRPVYKRVS